MTLAMEKSEDQPEGKLLSIADFQRRRESGRPPNGKSDTPGRTSSRAPSKLRLVSAATSQAVAETTGTPQSEPEGACRCLDCQLNADTTGDLIVKITRARVKIQEIDGVASAGRINSAHYQDWIQSLRTESLEGLADRILGLTAEIAIANPTHTKALLDVYSEKTNRKHR